MTRILLLGKDGQVGWELQRALVTLGDVVACGRGECDLADADRLRRTVRQVAPDVIVNAAAYTAVDRAESEAELAHAINANAPGLLAEEAKRLGAWLIHYSTDYVFDGSKPTAYVENDAANPLSVYGASKLDGERAVQQIGGRHLIFRTSWVFAARGNNFAKTMLRLAGERESLKIVGDQFGAPTSAELIADITAHCLRTVMQPSGESVRGLYHLAAAGETSWHGYALHVVTQAMRMGQALKCAPDALQPIPATEYPLPAKRPANSRLSTQHLQTVFGVCLPAWNYHVDRMLTEILETTNQ